MPEFLLHPSALSSPVVTHIKDGCLASPLVGSSPLAGTFESSRGFALAFRRDGLGDVLDRLPCVRAFVEQALDNSAYRALTPPFARLLRGGPNAFFLNLLLLKTGAGVGAHVDTTLSDASGLPGATPALVSVLYLEVPPDLRGGELVLWRGPRHVGTVRPEAGTFLHFRGDLRHEVREVSGLAEGSLRVSLVCEQYVLPKKALRRLQRCRVLSRIDFGKYLEAQAKKPLPTDLVLDPPGEPTPDE